MFLPHTQSLHHGCPSRPMRMTALVAFAMLCMAAVTSAATSEESLLHSAIASPSTTEFTLTKDILLTANLPQLPDGKVFALTGKLNGDSRPVKIDGRGMYNMFVNSKSGVVTLSLSNLIITGAKGAAVELGVMGTKLDIHGVTFTNVSRALTLDTVTATITKSHFMGSTNTAVYLSSQDNGGMDAVKFRSCRFMHNKADPRAGGGAIYGTMHTTVIIESSTFIDNYSAHTGGAVHFHTAQASIRSSKFLDNVAKEQAGAVAAYNAQLTIVGSMLEGNIAETKAGGALLVSSDGKSRFFASVSKTSFDNNQALNDFGGAFLLDMGARIAFCSCTFKGNTGRGSLSNGLVVGGTSTITTTPMMGGHDGASPTVLKPSEVKEGSKGIFISYRRAPDSTTAELLYYRLAEEIQRRQPQFSYYIFLDVKSTHLGDQWRQKLSEGLQWSTLFLPIMSTAALEHFKEEGRVRSRSDNLLNEYDTALGLHNTTGMTIVPLTEQFFSNITTNLYAYPANETVSKMLRFQGEQGLSIKSIPALVDTFMDVVERSTSDGSSTIKASNSTTGALQGATPDSIPFVDKAPGATIIFKTMPMCPKHHKGH